MGNHDHPAHEPWDALPEGFADYLELESRLSEPVRHAALEQAAGALETPPSNIIDIGSGTGADALALAKQFPTARVHALDVSAELLERALSSAAASEFAGQVEVHRVDLNDDWSTEVPSGVDLAWASLSLHHLSDPAAALQRLFTTLRPGGVLALTELTGEALFTPSDLGSGRTGLQDRMTHAMSTQRAHVTPEWSQFLVRAGFTIVEHEEHEFLAYADTVDGAQYLQMQLRAQRERLTGDLTDEDLAGIDSAIAALRTGRSEVSFSAGRSVWIAARPKDGEPDSPVTTVLMQPR